MADPGILGIHHVTAIGSDPRRNLHFYREALGLRLVKRTVNFDDPGTYHLYYGDGEGRPGTILTFFPWPGARRGSRGAGQATATAFSVPAGSLGWWRERLAGRGATVGATRERFGREVLTFLDPDGLELELVADGGAARAAPWGDGPVTAAHALRGFHSVTLTVERLDETAALLAEGMGFATAGEHGDRIRFELGDPADPGTLVDLRARPGLGRGRVAAGTVHHVAWRVAGESEQLAWRERLLGRGLRVTPVLERHYFRSVYFREPGGVLFEIATDPPGFTADEPLASLGAALRLPPWLEPDRARIEAMLPSLEG